ncbi:3-oxoacyl-[acyl-carrier protein] reductase [Thermoflexales bacterium]|nr:3-oxoacyl-[acyl-carrier protein] reductase [Thermoflexales bacterium]
MGLFEGQVAWVTGAGRGIGRAVALALAEQGAAVALVSRTQHEIEMVAQEIRSHGGTAIASLLDVSNWDMVHWTAQQIEAALGPIDLLINNAGVLEPLGKLWETDPEQAGRLIDINLSGAYYGMRAVLPGMIKRGRGVIVNVSSDAATAVAQGWSVYAASKAGLDQLTRTAAFDLKDTAIRVYSLHPGLVDTRMQETLRAATPDRLPPDRRKFFIDQKEAGKVQPPEAPARTLVWLCSTHCDLENGAIINLRSRPELQAKIDRVLGA